MNMKYNTIKVRQKLEAKRKKLLGNVPPQSRGSNANPDSGDLASRYERWQRNTSLDQIVEKQLAEIDLTLKRLDDGTYGICTTCGGPISKARLMALPQTPLCLKCRLKQEKRLVSH
jgi:RNA polymerase-binding transcription factor DksA